MKIIRSGNRVAAAEEDLPELRRSVSLWVNCALSQVVLAVPKTVDKAGVLCRVSWEARYWRNEHFPVRIMREDMRLSEECNPYFFRPEIASISFYQLYRLQRLRMFAEDTLYLEVGFIQLLHFLLSVNEHGFDPPAFSGGS